MLARLGLLGDLHAEHDLLATALAFLAPRCDAILAVGDVADGPGDLDRACALLDAHGAITVRGNHDRWFLAGQQRSLPDAHRTATDATRAYLAALPATRQLATPAGSVLLCHGLGPNDMARLTPDDEGYALEVNTDLHALLAADHAIVVGGHTHRRMIRAFGATVLVNPGTLHRHHEPGFMLLDTATRTVQIHRFGADGSLATPSDHRLDDRFP